MLAKVGGRDVSFDEEVTGGDQRQERVAHAFACKPGQVVLRCDIDAGVVALLFAHFPAKIHSILTGSSRCAALVHRLEAERRTYLILVPRFERARTPDGSPKLVREGKSIAIWDNFL